MTEPEALTRRRKRRLFAVVAGYLFWLIIVLIIGTPESWPAWYAYGAIPLAGLLVTLVVVAAIYEVFAIDLPFLLDTFRFGIRRILPRRLARPLSAWLTRTWQRAPGWMRKSGLWMPDDEPFDAPKRRSARGNRND